MSTGLTDLGYKTVLYGEDGAMLYGLQEVEGLGERFFDTVTGEVATNCWVSISDSHRGYFNENGVPLFIIKEVEGDSVLVDDDDNPLHGLIVRDGLSLFADPVTGVVHTGWFEVAGFGRYYATSDYFLISGEARLNGSPFGYSDFAWYYFDANSHALVTGWKYLSDGNKWVYYNDLTGCMLYGQQRLHSDANDTEYHWYLLDSFTGAASHGFQWIRNQHKVVYYDPVMSWMIYGWNRVNSVNYLFNNIDGHLQMLDTGDSRKNYYINWALSIALDDSHGYDQVYRWGERGDYDCSSLVVSSLKVAGLNTGGATYTGNMKSQLTANGFIWITDFSDLRAGDILLNEAFHTAIYLGNGILVHASGNEFDDAIGGMPGDQTGEEIYIRTYYWRPWNGILRLV
ncbi:NlpC/P60 family protein, partial [Collinsella sp. LCP19S3_B11]|uniref:NlpC/P60 family protein n=1 Tax=Collinsella sp. LCP19S3_B11 TaxID=3438754 RepID=UPI003F8E300E